VDRQTSFYNIETCCC